MPLIASSLQEGIAAAKAGEYDLARQLLHEAAENPADSDIAWMWLARIAPNPDQALACLQRILSVRPQHPAARAALPAIRLQAGIGAAKLGDRYRSRSLLTDFVADEPNNEIAWLWLAHVADSPESAIASLERVLEINPNHEKARKGLQHFRSQLPEAHECPLCLHRQAEKIERCAGCGAWFCFSQIDSVFENAELNFPLVRQAISRLRNRVRHGDEEPGLRLALGWAFLNGGDIASAIDWFDQAANALPSDRPLKQFLHQLRCRQHEFELCLSHSADNGPTTQVLGRSNSGEAERRRQAARNQTHAESSPPAELLPAFAPPTWEEPNYETESDLGEPLPKTEELSMRCDRRATSTKELMLPPGPAISVRMPAFMQCALRQETKWQAEILNVGDVPVTNGEASLRLNGSWALLEAPDAIADPGTRMLRWKLPPIPPGSRKILQMTVIPALGGQYQQEFVVVADGTEVREKTSIRNESSESESSRSA
ncbi:MAG: tetratricopeptide repeat protein [Gemmataceae bacterium]|nr:tetratricopeptide repeat protein [Gemmataceae bacterium]